ncbi:outer membrane lipoprotein LolB [Massilia norwichensis]|jgi:outer membrane lipoprotein LolB|uniref:Outer-membrane lipoprotein LolB n=1 Tax=Massilia norwichensis TaxID=1442366 RepID=A0ABT2A2P9_9BURK|nr:outer membrane lipoprotein LolB [Massilia norwichensis]MCS0588150.1 outer membrane lipoprotein LolB [Massilia norwichensis]
MPITRFSRHLLAAAFAISLAGCATSTANLSSAPVGAYRDTIDLNGKINVVYQKSEGGREGVNGQFSWTQRPGRIEVALFTPTGQTAAEITVTPESATLTQANREPRTAKDIDALTQQALGYALPVAGLRDWLQGYAVDAQGKRFVASPSNNNVQTRDGWQLRFTEWQDKPGANGAPLPKLIRAERGATGNGGELSIGITIFPES